MGHRVVITRRVPPPAESLLREAGCDVHLFDQDDPPARDAVLSAVDGASGVIAQMSDRVDDAFLDAAGPTLRVVANFAVGFDNIVLDACQSRDVWATNTPGVLTEATADIAWTLILGAARHAATGHNMVAAGEWPGWAPLQLLGLELNGATLGVVGAGRIGSATARRSIGFGMRVVYTHPRRQAALEDELSARRLELDELLQSADVVSLHIPMRPENHHLIDARRLALMKPGAILVNTARGAVVDEAALVAGLRAGRPAAAGLDVYEHEPELTPGLAELSNVMLLPHLGSGTTVTRERMSRMVAENVLAALRGETPPNPIR